MTHRSLRVGSVADVPELRDLAPVARGEGFVVHTATLDGRPCLVVDCGTMDDLVTPEPVDAPVTIHVFEDERGREAMLRAQVPRRGASG